MGQLRQYLRVVVDDERRRRDWELNDYCLSNKDRIDNFVVENLQKTSDFQQSLGPDPDLSAGLQAGLQAEVCGHSRLALPWAFYPALLVYLCLSIAAPLVYTVAKGRDVMPDEIGRWMGSVLIGIGLEMVVFQPLKVVLWEMVRPCCTPRRLPAGHCQGHMV